MSNSQFLTFCVAAVEWNRKKTRTYNPKVVRRCEVDSYKHFISVLISGVVELKRRHATSHYSPASRALHLRLVLLIIVYIFNVVDAVVVDLLVGFCRVFFFHFAFANNTTGPHSTHSIPVNRSEKSQKNLIISSFLLHFFLFFSWSAQPLLGIFNSQAIQF